MRIGAEARLVERNNGRGCDCAISAVRVFAGCPPLKVPSARIRSPPQPVLIGMPFSSSILGGRLVEDLSLFSALPSPVSPFATSLSFLFLCCEPEEDGSDDGKYPILELFGDRTVLKRAGTKGDVFIFFTVSDLC